MATIPRSSGSSPSTSTTGFSRCSSTGEISMAHSMWSGTTTQIYWTTRRCSTGERQRHWILACTWWECMYVCLCVMHWHSWPLRVSHHTRCVVSCSHLLQKGSIQWRTTTCRLMFSQVVSYYYWTYSTRPCPCPDQLCIFHWQGQWSMRHFRIHFNGSVVPVEWLFCPSWPVSHNSGSVLLVWWLCLLFELLTPNRDYCSVFFVYCSWVSLLVVFSSGVCNWVQEGRRWEETPQPKVQRCLSTHSVDT